MHFSARHTILVALAAVLVLGGCGGSDEAKSSGITVAAAFYPLEFAVHSVGGTGVDVIPLSTPGVEAHDVALTPRQVAAAVQSDLVVYLSGFQPAMDEAVKEVDPDKVLDVGQFANLLDITADDHEDTDAHEDDHAHGDFDPHFWLDPVRLAAVTDAIAERLSAIDPDQAELFAANARGARAELSEVDEEFTEGLQTCARRELFTSHAAFAYLASRYDLTQVSVVGITPDAEPSGARIAEVQKLAREYGATTIFFETAATDAFAKSIAHDLGLETAVLDPIELISDQSDGEDYLGIMESNLAAIQKANDCG